MAWLFCKAGNCWFKKLFSLFFVILIVFKTLSIHFDFGFFMCEGHAPG